MIQLKTSILFIALALLTMQACKSNDKSHPATSLADSTKSKHSIEISTFPKSLDMDSCKCLYAIDSVLFKEKQYILAYDLATTAFMNVNGDMRTFKQNNFTDAGYSTLTYFGNKNYDLILETANVKEIGKEETIQTGSLRIMDKEGSAYITTFYGMCGCFKKSKNN